jgi:hypothetical protein
MKTIEENAKDYNAQFEFNGVVFENANDVRIEAFKAGFELAQRWIQVEENLPENYMQVNYNKSGHWTDDVIVMTDKSVYLILYRCEINHGRLSQYNNFTWNKFDGEYDDRNGKVVKWRPIELK